MHAQHSSGPHGYEYGGSSNPGQRRYIYRGTSIRVEGRHPVEHHNYGGHGFEHGGSSNHIDERDYEEHYDDEALASALMTMGVDDRHSSTPSSPDNTTSNHPV